LALLALYGTPKGSVKGTPKGDVRATVRGTVKGSVWRAQAPRSGLEATGAYHRTYEGKRR